MTDRMTQTAVGGILSGKRGRKLVGVIFAASDDDSVCAVSALRTALRMSGEVVWL